MDNLYSEYIHNDGFFLVGDSRVLTGVCLFFWWGIQELLLVLVVNSSIGDYHFKSQCLRSDLE